MKEDLTQWRIEGEIRCPDDCGLYFSFEGTPAELLKFTKDHDCAKADADRSVSYEPPG